MDRSISLSRPPVVCTRHPLAASRFLRARLQEQGALFSQREGLITRPRGPYMKPLALTVHCPRNFTDGN